MVNLKDFAGKKRIAPSPGSPGNDPACSSPGTWSIRNLTSVRSPMTNFPLSAPSSSVMSPSARQERGGVTTAKALAELDASDWKIIGTAFTTQLLKERAKAAVHGGSETSQRKSSVKSVVQEYPSLKQMTAERPWYPSLMEGLLCNRFGFQLLVTPSVKTTLKDLTSDEADHIGRSINKPLRSKTTAALGCNQWMLQTPAIKELCEIHPFFMAMVEVISEQKVKDAWWGLNYKLYVGAAFGIFNAFTDIFAIIDLFINGYYSFAWRNIYFILLSMFLQGMLTIAQNSKRGWKAVAWEFFLIITMSKQIANVRRVSSGNVQLDDTMFDPQFELTAGRLIEIFSQSVPSAISLFLAILSAAALPYTAIISVFVSCLVTGYISTVIALDYDIDPIKRIHAAGKFVCLLLMSRLTNQVSSLLKSSQVLTPFTF